MSYQDSTGSKPVQKTRRASRSRSHSSSPARAGSQRQLSKSSQQHRQGRSVSRKKAAMRRKAQLRNRIRLGGAILLLLLLFLSVRAWLSRHKTTSLSTPPPPGQTEAADVLPAEAVTIGATGSFIIHDDILHSCQNGSGAFDFSPVFTYITPVYSMPDFMTCELEGALAGPESGYSGYPAFNSPDRIATDIQASGVDLQLLATNHIYDEMSEGFNRTLQVYEEKRIPYTGIRTTTSQKPYTIAEAGNIRIGFIDYTYETAGEGTALNEILVDEEDAERINTFDYDELDSFYSELERNLASMRKDGAQFLVVNMHWGTEYHLEPTDVQRQMAQRIADMGADALIGGHPHCEEPIDVLDGPDGKKMFIIYSVGNAFSNQRKEILSEEMPEGQTEDGVVVLLSLLRDEADDSVSIIQVNAIPTWVYRSSASAEGTYTYYILPLDDVEHIEENTGLAGIAADARASRLRTMNIIGSGLQKAREIFTWEGSADK